MFERNISAEDVRKVLSDGVVIEESPDDLPYPSRLIFGWCEDRPIHVVVAINEEESSVIVAVNASAGPYLDVARELVSGYGGDPIIVL